MAHSWFVLSVCALATYRATRLIVTDAISASLREWLRVHGYKTMVRNVAGEVETRLDVTNRLWAFAFRLVSCSWCVSLWTGFVVVALVRFEWSWFQYAAYALALSSLAGVLSERTDG